MTKHQILQATFERRSVIPGRVRWQINSFPQDAGLYVELEKQLKIEIGVTRAHANPRTGRLLVLHDYRSNIEQLETVISMIVAPTVDILEIEEVEPVANQWPDLRHNFIHSPNARKSSMLFVGAASLSALRIVAMGFATNALWRAPILSFPALLVSPLGINLAVMIGTTLLHKKLKKASREMFKQHGLDQERQIRLAIGHRLLHADLGALESQSTTDLSNSIRTNLGQIERGFDGAAELMNITANTAILANVFLFIAPRLSWLPMLTIAAMGVVVRRSYKDIQRQSDETDKSRNDSDRVLTEMTEGLPTVKSYGLEKHFLRKIVEHTSARNVTIQKASRRTINYPLQLETVTLFGLSAVTLVAGLSVVAGTMSPGTHIILMSVAGYMFYPFSNMGPPLDSINRGMASYHILKEIAALPIEKPSNVAVFSKLKGHRDVEFQNVNFTYPEGRGPTLVDMNLKMEEGKVIGIVGESGSGKSTLIKLLQRFYAPAHGTICIGGVDIQEIGHRDLRSMFACIDQRSFLFEGSLKYNIGLGRENAGQEEIETAAKSAGIHTFINSLPEKYATQIGAKGSKLSDGQRQRVLLARCFLRDAPFLVLDEGTANLDIATEREILSNIKTHMPGHTVIVIAHRLPTIEDADVIVVLKGGRIVEKGNHRSLVQKNGAYQALLSGKNGAVTQLFPAQRNI